MKKLRFGGPGLPKGTHTFYETPDGRFVDHITEGHEVDCDLVHRAQEYVERGQATIVQTPEAPDASPAAEDPAED